MKYLIYIFAAIGAICFLLSFVLPLLEAILYGHICHFINVNNIKWNKKVWTCKFALKVLWWLFYNPWQYACKRMFGMEAYNTEITQGKWTYRPPFGLKRNKGMRE